jgi:hypothetical protein
LPVQHNGAHFPWRAYSKLTSDAEFRKQVTEKVGLGFEFPLENAPIGRNGRKTQVGAAEELAVSY